MCVREYSMQIPYGVVKIDNNVIAEIDEKPLHKFFVNAGIYVLESNVVDFIPANCYFDMTTLFDQIRAKGYSAAVFPVREYWIDIGHHEDYAKANSDFGAVFIDD